LRVDFTHRDAHRRAGTTFIFVLLLFIFLLLFRRAFVRMFCLLRERARVSREKF
jgi:hypothetical protein